MRFVRIDTQGSDKNFLPNQTPCTGYAQVPGPGLYDQRIIWTSNIVEQRTWDGILHTPSYITEWGKTPVGNVELFARCEWFILPNDSAVEIGCRLEQYPGLPFNQQLAPQQLIDAAMSAELTSAGIFIFQATNPFE